MKKLIKTLTLVSILFVATFLLSGCEKSSTTNFITPSIKDDFCGVVINYQYCKCAFHNKHCEEVAMSPSSASYYVHNEYNKWLNKRKKDFKDSCEAREGIYNGSNKCKYCEDPYHKENNKCVKEKNNEENENENSETTNFIPNGPFNSNCTINEDIFENDWKKYSDFDDNIEFNSRSWEVQENLNTYEKIINLKVRNFELERDMEIDRQSRLALREYKGLLVNNIRTNLLKSFWRLSYVTYSTIKSASGIGKSYSTVLTSAETLPVISNGLKVIQAVIPANSKLAIDTTTISGKVKSVGFNAALEAFDSMGDPIKIATQIFNDAGNATLPSADISPEEIAILRTQHLENKTIDKVLAQSYRNNAIRRMELLDNKNRIILLEADANSWQTKEKARVRAMLERDCQHQKDAFENEDTSFINIFINKALAQENTKINTYTFGDYNINYTEKNIEENGDINYYQNKNLILSVYDTNDNDQPDLWIKYDKDLYVIFEAYDTTDDGQIDTTLDLNKEEVVSNLVQPELKIPEESIETDNDINKNNKLENYSTTTEKNESNNSKNIFWILAVSIIGFFIYVKKKQNK